MSSSSSDDSSDLGSMSGMAVLGSDGPLLSNAAGLHVQLKIIPQSLGTLRFF
jgi:hypothetical protein